MKARREVVTIACGTASAANSRTRCSAPAHHRKGGRASVLTTPSVISAAISSSDAGVPVRSFKMIAVSRIVPPIVRSE